MLFVSIYFSLEKDSVVFSAFVNYQPRSQGLSSLRPLSLEAEKRDPGNEVGEL